MPAFISHDLANYTRRLIASLPVPDPQEQARRRQEHRAILGI